MQMRQRGDGSEFLQSVDGDDAHIRILVAQSFDQRADGSIVPYLSQCPGDVVIYLLISQQRDKNGNRSLVLQRAQDVNSKITIGAKLRLERPLAHWYSLAFRPVRHIIENGDDNLQTSVIA